ncbi:MAG: RICIN domain-containing protein [Atopobiaceae bacterium]|nr:RICIN domain-containing protein [Atopobiaceae bacterium]
MAAGSPTGAVADATVHVADATVHAQGEVPEGREAEDEGPKDPSEDKDAEQPELPPIADETVFDISPELTGSSTRVATQGDRGSEGTNVESDASANVLGQYWRTVSLGGSEYRFVSLKGGALGYDAATERANVRIVGKDSDDARWTLVKNDDGSYSLAPAADRSLRLDVSGAGSDNGTNLQVWDDNGTKAQRFSLQQAQLVENGTYAIESGLSYPLVLDVSCGSSDDGANVQLWSTNGSAAQHFRVTLNQDGTYSIVNAATGKSLDITGASRRSGATLQMYEVNGTDAQKWTILPGEGGLKIRSIASGLDLDAAGGVAAKGTNVQQYYGNDTKAQLWSFKDGSWEYFRGFGAVRERVIQAAREQEGVRYWSMHSGPRGSEDEGFGCAMLVCYAYNKVLGTDWYGHCWYLWGSANGTGGFDYPLEVVSDPEPGDIVMYLDYDSGWCEAASHAALYVGNGRVIGANGEGSPYRRPWWGRVEETSVGAQAYGRLVRYIRYRWF